MSEWAEVLKNSLSRLGIVKVRSALNPMIWASTMIPIISWVFAYLLRDFEVAFYLLLGLGFLPILALIGGFIYFARTDPTKLQSEEYQIKHEALQVIERKGGRIPLSPADLVEITNPVSGQSDEVRDA